MAPTSVSLGTGRVSMQGASMTSAPSSRKRLVSVPKRSAGLVTATVRPRNGSLSYQSRVSANAQTSPTTRMAGLVTPASREASATVARVASTRRWRAVVPRSTMAAGVEGSMPAASRPRAISGVVETAIMNTSVPPTRASASKSMPSSPFSRRCPVTKWTEAAQVRSVAGMPAYDSAETALVTPGTTSKGTPAAASSRASSPPRPKM